MSFIRHEPCPECGSRNNLARYSDGGAFCFGCHHRESATHRPMRTVETQRERPEMPEDVGHEFPAHVVEWLARFHVDLPTAIRMGLVYSPSRDQLIYQMGNVWQARNFREGSKSKNFTSGDVNECLHIYSIPREGLEPTLVIVEDPVSAIRIAPQYDAMPLLGSHLATARLNALAGLYERLVFWLDSDKLKESRGMAERAKYMGLSARTIWTAEDPKCYTDEQIQEILGEIK